MHTQLKPRPQAIPETKLKVVPARAPAPSWFEKLFQGLGVSGEIKLPDGRIVATGAGDPRFRITVHSQKLLRRPLDELSLGQAYVAGDLDLDGDMVAILDVRKQLADRLRLPSRLRFLHELFLMPVARVHKKVIDRHYTTGNDFFLSFLDTHSRLYSHCLFEHDDDSLEQAAAHKMDQIFQARSGYRHGMGWNC
jgi:cyclopropane-fatty-acyl-phospholipid synthase